ncbi:glycerate kinase [Oceanobacillus jeddahense]|uniref:Glycerate kinase n=1 Tax=Oceanobacillus jeddahense TaxID=1462527 RepID=A0ABY5JUX6_9BACI|nr:glycerate kinase [Oceanobacillus jeddahense]UUI03604.1 glycerate kinase [Oceanobacillus jeddahense]
MVWEKIKSYYAMMNDGTVIIEIAQICGLPIVSVNRRNPLHMTTYGAREAIIHTVNNGVDWFMKKLQIKETIQQIDIVITGEGKFHKHCHIKHQSVLHVVPKV